MIGSSMSGRAAEKLRIYKKKWGSQCPKSSGTSAIGKGMAGNINESGSRKTYFNTFKQDRRQYARHTALSD